jgi:rhodanese-related sulfurtransferase
VHFGELSALNFFDAVLVSEFKCLKHTAMVIHLSPEEVAAKLRCSCELILLDVRTPAEFLARRIPQSINIPLDELYARHTELDASREIIVLCEHGIRSIAASGLLSQLGFKRVFNMVGGLSRWRHETISG